MEIRPSEYDFLPPTHSLGLSSRPRNGTGFKNNPAALFVSN